MHASWKAEKFNGQKELSHSKTKMKLQIEIKKENESFVPSNRHPYQGIYIVLCKSIIVTFRISSCGLFYDLRNGDKFYFSETVRNE